MSLPDLATYSFPNGNSSEFPAIFQASGAMSMLSLPDLTSVQGVNIDFGAIEGGTLSMPAMQTLETTDVALYSENPGSVVNLPAMTSFGGTSSGHCFASGDQWGHAPGRRAHQPVERDRDDDAQRIFPPTRLPLLAVTSS